MPTRIPSTWRGLALLALAALPLALPPAAAAEPFEYRAVPDESNVSTYAGLSFVLDVNPDFTELLPGGDDFPLFANLSGFSNTFASPASRLTAEVGLPDVVGSEISFSTLRLNVPNVPGTLIGGDIIRVPLDLTGSPIQLISFTATVSKLDIVLNEPFSSTLTPIGEDEWAWAGLANVHITGEINPTVNVPTMDPVALVPVPFEQDAMLPLFGTFGGDDMATWVTLGAEIDPLVDPPIEIAPDPTFQQFDIGELGLVTGFLSLNAFAIQELSTDVFYLNDDQPLPLPEPGGVAMLAVGALALGALSRTRR